MATEARRATLEIQLNARNATTSAFGAIHGSLAKIRQVGRDAFTSVTTFAGSTRAQLLGVVAALGGIQKLLIEPAKFEESLVRIAIASKSLENDIDRVRTAIEELAVSTGTRREDLAAGFEVAAKRARTFEEALKLVTTANQLATVSGAPVKDSLVELTAVMEAFGIGIAEVDRVAAKLFATTQRLPATAGDLIGELSRVGPEARDAGLGLEQVLAAIVSMEREGVKAKRTLRDFDNILQVVTENGKSFRDELKTITATGVPEFLAAFNRVDGTIASLIDGFKELGKVAALAFARPQFGDLENVLADAAQNIERIRAQSQLAGLEFAKWRHQIAPAIDAVQVLWNSILTGIEAAKQGFSVLFKTFVDIPYNLGRLGRATAEQFTASIRETLAGTKIGDLLGFTQEEANRIRNNADALAKDVEEAFDRIGKDLIEGAFDIVKAADKTDQAFVEFQGGLEQSRQQVELLNREIAKLEKEMRTLGSSAEREGQRVRDSFDWGEAQLQMWERIRGQPTAESFDARPGLLASGQEDLFPSTDAAGGKLEDLFEREARLAQEHSDRLVQIAQGAHAQIQASFAGSFDGFIQGALSAKEAAAEFGRSIVSMLNQLVANSLFESVFGVVGQPGRGSAAFGGLVNAIFSAKGNVLPGSFMPVKAFAQGGVITRPTIGVIREAGMNEAVVPLPDGRRIPVKMLGGGGGVTNNHYWTVNAMDGPSVMRVLTSAAGRRAHEAVAMNAARTRRGAPK